ncbi:MAG: Dam family site-specific DNA-(adenine-N6)-methyltransferase [Rhodospirillales bacterium]|nr:Dam family site-specific DNA-(adenine-N6)-methyltransferase [Rhodospirillales bacterium]
MLGAVSIRPPLRWAGSKRRSLSYLVRQCPDVIANYVEPFAGSACLAFALQPDALILGDLNPYLTEFYEFLCRDPEALHAYYVYLEATPERYYEIRREFNAATPSIERAARFLYLNRNCFNGIFRVNTKGKFNVPWGGNNVGAPLTLAELALASALLRRAKIICADFATVLDTIDNPDTFVYLDPPYASNETRVFCEYNVQSFSTKDWPRLVEQLDVLNTKGCRFLLSYAGDPDLITHLSKWNVDYIDVTRNVGGFKATRRKHREFVAANVGLLT